MKTARLISFWVGFVSLSLEIAWVRLYGYANSSTPKAFAFVLAIYLLGIALGAQLGKRICKNQSRSSIEQSTPLILTIAAAIAALGPWMYAYSQALALDDIAAPLLIFLTAGTLSILFPIAHHLGTPDESKSNSAKGKNFSKVYISNIMGSALGPLVTGYVLLDYLSITRLFPLLAFVLIATASMAWLAYGKARNVAVFTAFLLSIGTTASLAYKSWESPNELAIEFSTNGRNTIAALENRHGIITIAKEKPQTLANESFVDHSIYGGNVYDGKVNISLERNTNGLERPLALHVLQPQAKNVLILGLSIGSWLSVIEGFPGIQTIDVVEINPGYLDLAKNYGPQKRAIEDPRVNIVIDDARRWLQYNPERRYDLILMNTTFHWRANSSMLLSQEMMRLANRHLSPQGIVAFNATGSTDAFYTATTVFKETRRYQNFIYGANWDPFTNAANVKSWETLRNMMIDGKPAFSPESKRIEEFSQSPFVRIDNDRKRLNRPPEIITDDNMLVEYKYGRKN